MSVRKRGSENIRSLTKIGRGSIGLTLPIEMVRRLGWRERQKVTVKLDRKKMVIADWRQ